MGVIDLYNGSSLCMVKSSNGFCFSSSLKTRTCDFSRNQRKLNCMASISATVKEGRQQLTGDSFIRHHLRELSPYQSILPFEVLSTRLGRKPEEIVKLDANENPYGPPPEVFEALGAMKFPYIYPDPESRRLRAALAEDSGLESEYILVGCGADELIDLIMRCVLDPGDSIVDCPPTFTMYEFDAAVNCARVIKVPRKTDFSLDVEKIAEAVEHQKPKIIFLTSPNNPDGSYLLNLLVPLSCFSSSITMPDNTDAHVTTRLQSLHNRMNTQEGKMDQISTQMQDLTVFFSSLKELMEKMLQTSLNRPVEEGASFGTFLRSGLSNPLFQPIDD
ncbi:unnamed protein product [Lactuca virosa]|uniref:histidinol-phosphate transaminase n=1 Tax=Lactuca virosa TaxID=75947 RepID=A0AAU9P1T4_9ASTR|nr:unnamed protein product [Lactuca virosa]